MEMKKVKLFEQFIAEKISQDAYQIHVNLSTGQDATQHFIDDNNLDGEKLKKYVIQHKNSAEKYVVRDMINGTQPNPRLLKKFVKESQVTEATTSWSKMMSGVKKSETGPWSIVAIEYNKVVGQSNDIKIRDLIPAKYEALKAEFPRAKFHIEDGTGMVVWNESFINEAKDSTRDELMDLLETKYKIKSVRPSEEFDGQTEGIWIAADNDEELSGSKIFDYYNKSTKYKNGVLKIVVDAVEKRGWWFSWNDPGTMMCWPKN